MIIQNMTKKTYIFSFYKDETHKEIDKLRIDPMALLSLEDKLIIKQLEKIPLFNSLVDHNKLIVNSELRNTTAKPVNPQKKEKRDKKEDLIV